MIVEIIGGGFIFGVGAFSFWYLLGKPAYNFIKSRKNIEKAKLFLIELDSKIDPFKLTEVQREERERALANSGFTNFEITQAQKRLVAQKPTKQTDLDKIVEWFKTAEANGKTRDEAESMLIYHGWDKALIKKALNKITKLEKGNGKRQRTTVQRTFPSFPGTGDVPGATIGDGTTNGDGQIEHERIQPVSSLDRTSRVEQNPQRDWASFKRNS